MKGDISNKSELRVNMFDLKGIKDSTAYYSDDGVIVYYKGEPFTGIAFEMEESEEHGVYLALEKQFKDGMRHGYYRSYEEDGLLMEEINYKNNKLHGKNLSPARDRNSVCSVRNYKDGKLDGFCGAWIDGELQVCNRWKDGELVSEEIYENEESRKDLKMLNQIVKEFEESLTKEVNKNAEESFNGIKGNLSFCDNKGDEEQWVEEEFYLDSKMGIYRGFHEDGKLKVEGYYKDAKKHGVSKSYSDDGISLRSVVNFKNGKVNGPFKTYYENGNLYREGNFINFKYDGIIIQYFSNGMISDIEYHKEEINITLESKANMRKVLKEVNRQLRNGVAVDPYVYIDLCKELGIDPPKQ